MFTIVCVLAVLSFPQDPTPHSGAMPAVAAALSDPEAVFLDEPVTGGPLWALGGNFKVSFEAAGWTFWPRPLPGAPELEGVGFRLVRARVGSVDLVAADAAPARVDRRITFAHGDVTQVVDIDGRGVEQSFVFERLPQRGELVLELAVSTPLDGEETTEGIVLRSEFNHVTYSRAVAIDARGERVDAETRFVDGRIVIRVPEDFVARAAMPLIVDPRIASATLVPGGGDLADPDVACVSEVFLVFGNPPTYRAETTWCVVFGRYFGANDWDCHAQIFDQNLAPIGGLLPIDITTDGWLLPRVAGLSALWHNFLVVAEVRSGSAPHRILGRGIGSPRTTQYLYPQMVIASSSVDSLRPDVCGDATYPTFRPAYYTVVWEHAYSATDHDIYARQIRSDFTFPLPLPTAIQTDTANQTHPSISKSNGQASGLTSTSDQRVAIVWQNSSAGVGPDIHGCMLTWDGLFVPVGQSSGHVFVIDGSAGYDVRPQVSSPTQLINGRRLLLAVYERQGSNNGDIHGTCFDHLGNILATGNITALENAGARLGWPQFRPSVDTDGIRFGVAYHEVYQNNTTVNDLDTRMSVVALANGSSLLVEEPGAILGFSGNREFHVQVASLYGGGSIAQAGVAHSGRYLTTNDRDNTNNTFAIDAYLFEASPQPSFRTRATACGAATLAVAGGSIIGNTATFTVSPGMPLRGVVVGAAVNQPVAGCGGCTSGASGIAILGGAWSLAIPNDPAWIGLPLSVQGFGFDAVGPCFGQLHFTDTIDFTVL